MRIVTIIQTRCSSTRLPQKVLRPLIGKPLFVRMVERVKGAILSGEIVVATTHLPEDDAIEAICLQEGLNCYRGHLIDLLDRHYQAALQFRAEAIVKIPSDCPLIDPEVINRVLNFYIDHHNEFDYVSNLHPPTYPDGNDVEVMSVPALETAWHEAKRDYEREHTTPFLWDQPDRFRIGNVLWETGLDYSMTHRWTIDYEEDYLFIKAVYEELYHQNPNFNIEAILTLLRRRPEIQSLNKKYLGVNWYRHHLGRLKTIRPEQTKVTIIESLRNQKTYQH